MARSLQFDIVANDKATGKLGAVEKALGGFAGKLGGMAAGFLSLESVISSVMANFARVFEWGSGLKDAALAIGVTVEEFQKLEMVSKQTGLELGKLQKAFLEIRKLVRDAGSGNKEALSFIQALGYTQEQAASGTIDYTQAFLRVSEAVSAAGSEQQKFNILAGIFGDRVAQDLIPVMSKYGEMKATFANTPLVSDKDAEMLDRSADAMERLSRAFDVLVARVMIAAQNPMFMKIFGPFTGGGSALFRASLDVLAPEVPDQGPTDRGKQMADALASAGKKVAEQTGNSALGGNLPTMAAIGGAAGFRGGAGGVPRSETLLEQIEQNTRPAAPTPVNGGTNFTSGEQPAPPKTGMAYVAGRLVANLLK